MNCIIINIIKIILNLIKWSLYIILKCITVTVQVDLSITHQRYTLVVYSHFRVHNLFFVEREKRQYRLIQLYLEEPTTIKVVLLTKIFQDLICIQTTWIKYNTDGMAQDKKSKLINLSSQFRISGKLITAFSRVPKGAVARSCYSKAFNQLLQSHHCMMLTV